MRTTSAPQRRATSHMRSPNTPLAPTIDGVARFDQVDEARLHARPSRCRSPGTSARSSVRKTVRRRAIVSSMIAMNSGSMCPSIGRPSAATASGYGFDGPGPSSRRSVMGMRGEPTRPQRFGAATRDMRGVRRQNGGGQARARTGNQCWRSWRTSRMHVVAGGHAARDLGRGACHVRDVVVGELPCRSPRRRAARSAPASHAARAA